MAPKRIGVIGGGAAGFFGAIACAQNDPNAHVTLFEKNRVCLSKVKISGGGRCNVTHACFDPKVLASHYPRGSKALIGPFTHFGPLQTVKWFESRGVKLKAEDDGRMFPESDRSETIISCLLSEAYSSKVNILTECGVEGIDRKGDLFSLHTPHENFLFNTLLVATGSNSKMWEWLKQLGHTIIPPVPSLFTFNIPDFPLKEIAGISLEAVSVKIQGTDLKQKGPLLVTHWGFSGPAILKLSAWGARILHEMRYEGTLLIDWLPDQTEALIEKRLFEQQKQAPNQQIQNSTPFPFPNRLWQKFLEILNIQPARRWSTFTKSDRLKLLHFLKQSLFPFKGKSTYKEEFVTCGGVDLKEINFKTMESKICPGLFFAGEVVDIDGITGGFNFQNAWTTSWIAAQAIVL